MPAQQLTLDGRAEPYPGLARARRLPLTHGQLDVIAYLRLHGTIRPGQAGTIVHLHRVSDRRFCQPPTKGRITCCEYASSDGVEALKRLASRGLVEKVSDGLYVLNEGEQ